MDIIAAENKTTISPIINLQETESDTNEPIVLIEKIENATYYSEKTNSYTVVIGLYEKVADCSILDVQTNTIRSAIIPIEDINSILPLTRNGDTTSQFNAIKDAILNGTLTLLPYTVQKVVSSNVPVTRASSTDKAKIMKVLYGEGWPKAYNNVLRGSKTENGVTAKLYHTLSYRITDYDFTFIATAVSVIVTLTGLSVKTIQDILTLVFTAKGIWETVKEITLGRFDTFEYEDKMVRIGDLQQYRAGRTNKWEAVVGDIGAALTFKYERKDGDFYQNDVLLEKGLNNYFEL